MGVTHVIRGDDHLTNAARHGALGVDAYRAMGYLPAALRNYLVRLGWSQGDKEFFTGEEVIAAFDLNAIGRSPSRFDYAKLENMNGHFMRAASDDDLFAALIGALPYLPGGPEIQARLDEVKRVQMRAAIPGLKERAKTLVELLDGAGFLFAERPLGMDEKAADILAKGGRTALRALLPRLANASEWTGSALEAVVRAYVEESGAKLGAVAQPLRAALTGRSTSPGIFDVLTVLGRAESLGRIEDQAM
jgi:glutamyl-tRNA synthetase